jgi:hypothetical protein
MKAAKTWCLAGLILVAGFTSVSCGKDEGTDGGGGHGTVIGGSGGSTTGGMTGRSGSVGSEGGDDTGPTAATKLGRACVTDKECVDPAAPGLTCVTAKEAVLGDGAPPKGLCTMPCTRPQEEGDVDACVALGGMCYPFGGSNTEGYCIEACGFGEPDIGDAKCHSRPEFTCAPALVATTDDTCVEDGDCQDGDLCFDGECTIIFPGCLPGCRGDIDCDAGSYCDQDFLKGVCTPVKQIGKTLGEACTVTPANEPDDCLGFCRADAEGSTNGHCAANCGLFNPCAWNSATEKFDGFCGYGSGFTTGTVDTGDFGYCTPSCNCTDDCGNPGVVCSILDDVALPATFRGPGLCFAPEADTVEYNQCNGAGGAGGDGAGGDGAGGDNASGAPNGGAGSGGAPAGG